MTNRKPIPNRSSSAHEKLTDDERVFLTDAMLTGNTDRVACPDCQQGLLLIGPSGGMSNNTMCEFCQSEFNLTFYGKQCIFAERISDAGPRDAGERKSLYSGYYGSE